jgi:hypothetical protein
LNRRFEGFREQFNALDQRLVAIARDATYLEPTIHDSNPASMTLIENPTTSASSCATLGNS